MGSSTIERLARDTRSSSAAIVKAACQEFARIAEKRSRDELRDAVTLLLAAHPSMGALLSLGRGLESRLKIQTATDELVYFATAFEQQFSRHLEQVAIHGMGCIPNQGIIMTYSASGSVGAALQAAFDAGKRFHVLLSEARPAGEGIDLARRLSETGIPTTLMTDLALANRVGEANLLLVGCDAIIPTGVINKMGTHALALLAKMANVPAVCLAVSEKIVDEDGVAAFRIVEHSGRELEPTLPTGIKVENTYFDCTPATLFTSILLEDGPFTSPSQTCGRGREKARENR